ncbi:thioredoxin family protein [Silvimonas iriomotensis]|uniref:Thioredoxin n=1 Tax=Silvimonas iriomotensis TaxID=449662 RepID=A0ABQ2PAD3_9NEIS|nr:thioredoxin family protein [Silvimonas iriomotensis]GGP22355.1 thioredoxin [Silvimonas iriomotensis]
MRTLLCVIALAAACVGAVAFGTQTHGGNPTAASHTAAPEFTGVTQWINSPPLTMNQLRGKVVLVDFWTYSCINCIHTLPHVKAWYDKYKDQGLVVVGVHTPEYPYEASTANLQDAIKRYGIHYPVAQDNHNSNWDAWQNQFWPAIYLVDAQGQVVYRTIGEGQYDETEAQIQQLLAQARTAPRS